MAVKQWALLILVIAAVAAAVGLYVQPDSVAAISEKWRGSTHANAESRAFTYWDDQGFSVIPPGCAKCHSTFGFQDFLGEDGTEAWQVDEPAKTGTVVNCVACHNPTAHEMTRVEFPSGAEMRGLNGEAVCMQCHQGLRSTEDVAEAIANVDLDDVDRDLSFINVHYYIAAATWAGTEVQGGYEYPDRSYVGRFEHVPDVQACDECHDPHSQRVDPKACSPCHVQVADVGDLDAIRTSEIDFDGDGNQEEGVAGEIETLQEAAYAAMQDYASQVVGTPLAYANRFPYFVVDTNENGDADSDELNGDNQYDTWTPRLLRVAYNYHFSRQDPGNYSHNARYVIQLLYDSLADLDELESVDLGAATRPAVR
jgi:hypothetical protein